MKYVKSFNESTFKLDDYYIEVDMLEYDTAYSEMRKGNIENLNTRDDRSIKRFLKSHDLKIVGGDGYYDIWPKHKTTSGLEYFSLFKTTEKYFFVSCNRLQRNVTKNDGFYRCDEIGGLMMLLKNIYSKYYESH